MRRSLNIWRVYLDLFSNFMSMVLLGGAGLLVMVGGALVSAKAGATTGMPKCVGYAQVRNDPALSGGVPNLGGCTLAMPAPDMRFAIGKADGQDDRVRDLVCQKLYAMVRNVSANNIRGARVEIVGSASEEYQNTAACKASKYWPRDAGEGFEPRDEHPEDRMLCNAPLAADRAITAFNICLSGALSRTSPDRPTAEDLLRFVAIAAEPSTSSKKSMCGTAADPGCDRTVYVRLRLENNAR